MPDTAPPICIASAQWRAEIDPLGAQLFALRDQQGRDLLWNGDPAVWNGRAPILFPIVGALAGGQYRLDGQVYKLPRHGFARTLRFAVQDVTPTSALLRLRWSPETFAVYPFHFELDLRFTLAGAALTVTATIKNLDDSHPMPASFGFHPALRWPLPYGQPRSGHAITFEKAEPAPVRGLDAEGTILAQHFPTPVTGRELVLRDSLFEKDAIIFDRLASRSVQYGASEGPRLRMDFPDTPYLGVWTKPGAGFICIEPWHGCADPQGYDGDFRNKPGVFVVAPGMTYDCTMTIALAN